MQVTFYKNPLLIGMTYEGGTLSLQFGRYRRVYDGVPQSLAYRLAYSRSASDTMSVFANEIKGKFEVIAVC
jgi:hypothetical protein